MANSRFTAVFSDIGGVLGTNGWDTALRMKIAAHFRCDPDEVQGRHRLMFDSYERGYMTFEAYIRQVFMFRPRHFTWEEVRDFAYNESIAWDQNIDLLRQLRRRNNITLALISNEGQGLTEHRVSKFGLREISDFMIFSYFVHLRKPDAEIWKLALNLAQVSPAESVYIDDRKIFADVAAQLGFKSIHHETLERTRAQLQDLGFILE
ncbi:MAG: HAD-IA family hydrolase [Acidobacteriaceae bacterium]|nr:HAD-IA family hydrolase [Acidobacteriaceae bacterium]